MKRLNFDPVGFFAPQPSALQSSPVDRDPEAGWSRFTQIPAPRKGGQTFMRRRM